MQQPQNIDESKVKALESIFGGQDITASVIRTVLSSNDNKFDDAVDSLLNMTTSNDSAPNARNPVPETREESLVDKREREKIKTLENMFGTDLSNSVICTVLESNRGELVDTVDTLLNMTSKDLNPQYEDPRKPVDRESERLRQEEDIKNYEEFKRLQIRLQEEEARAMKESQRKAEEDARLKAEAEKRAADAVQEQERVLREYEQKRKQGEERKKLEEEKRKLEEQKRRSDEEQKKRLEEEQQRRSEEQKRKSREEEEQKRIEEQKKRLVEEQRKRLEEEQRKQAELNRKEEELRRREEEMRKKEEERKNKALEAKQVEDARLLLEKLELEKKVKLQEEESHKKEQERLQKEWEERMKSLRAAEESIRRAETERKLAEDNRREELRLKEEALKQKAMEEERRLTKLREEEAKRLEKKRLEFEEELRIAEQRRQEEALRAQREQLLLLEKEAAQQKAEQERNAQRRVLEEERRALEERVRLENERMAIQKERAALEAAVKMQEALVEKKKQEEERRRQEQEEARIKAEREKEELLLRQKREYEELRLKAQRELEELRKEEERKLLAEEEAARRAEQELLDRQREQEERERLQREEAEAKRQEEELKAKEARQLAYEQMAASAVFIPPKTQSPQGTTLTATVVGDTVVCDWDLPEGNISPTNWIGLYPVRALTGTKKYTHFAYTNNTSAGQHVFKGVTPGHYEVRFFATKAYDHIARSAPVLVGPVATIIPQVQGDHVLVHYTLSPLSSAPTREWVGIYEKGQRRNKLYISTAYGNPEGQVMMKAPRNPGEYEVRLFANGSVYNEQAKAEFTVVDADCINVEPASVLAGANVSVSWILRTLEPSTGDWIGLYRADEQNNSNYLSCTYTNGSSVNSSTIAAPKEAGVYEFRLFSKAKGKYTTHRASGPLIVM